MARTHRSFKEEYMKAYNSNKPHPIYCHSDEVKGWKLRFQKEKQHQKKTNSLVTKLRLVFTWDEVNSILYVSFREWKLTTKQTRGGKK